MTTTPEARLKLAAYDAGILSDFGGGNVEWWQDYIRAELGRADDFYRSQVADLTAAEAGGGEPVAIATDAIGHIDRDAAADLLCVMSDLLEHNGLRLVADLVRDGEYDEHTAAQAFRDHRLASQTKDRALLDEAREILDNIARNADPRKSDSIKNYVCFPPSFLLKVRDFLSRLQGEE